MARGRVVPRDEGRAVVAKRPKRVLRSDLMLQDQPGADQIHRIGTAMSVRTTVVVNGFVLVPRVGEF